MRKAVLGLGFLLALRVPAAAFPDCAGPVELGHVRIMRVEPSDDLLVLHDGRAVHMEGIRFPHAAQDRAPAFIEQQAFNAIDSMARHHLLSVTALAPKEDRYDRVRGQVFSEDNPEPWLQLALLKSGLARVQIAPDRTECAAELYAAEAQARALRLGLWAVPNYQLRSPDQLGGDTGTFQIVEGEVVSADVHDGRGYLDFGPDWRTDFTVTIAQEDMENFRRAGIDPRDYQGKRIRVRGIVQQLNGPEIEIANPQQIEVVK